MASPIKDVNICMGRLAAMAPRLHRGFRGFESHPMYHFYGGYRPMAEKS